MGGRPLLIRDLEREHWFRHGTKRELKPSPKPGQRFSRRCRCGCGQWAKWIGLEGGVALIAGCDTTAHRWMSEQYD